MSCENAINYNEHIASSSFSLLFIFHFLPLFVIKMTKNKFRCYYLKDILVIIARNTKLFITRIRM